MTIETPEVSTETDTSEIQLGKEKMTQGIFTFNHVWPEALNGWHRLTLDLSNLPITPNSRVAASACEVKPGGTPSGGVAQSKRLNARRLRTHARLMAEVTPRRPFACRVVAV
jgi:hypothetical protein